MTLPVFLADELLDPPIGTLAPGDRARLGGSEGRHAAVVRRLAPGEELDVVDGAGLRVTCQVEATSPSGLDVVVTDCRREPSPRPQLALVQALAKGGRDEQAVETATEVGVDRVVAWQAHRSIVRWSAQKAPRALGRWRDTVRAAAKQSRRSWIPAVEGPLDSRGLCAWVRSLIDEGGACLVCHEEARRPLTGWLRDHGQHGQELQGLSAVALVVGPEGGIDDAEMEDLQEAGATPVLLGPHVLRSATAGPLAAALVCAASGRW